MNAINIFGAFVLLYLCIALSLGMPDAGSRPFWNRVWWQIRNLTLAFWFVLCASLYAFVWKG